MSRGRDAAMNRAVAIMRGVNAVMVWLVFAELVVWFLLDRI